MVAVYITKLFTALECEKYFKNLFLVAEAEAKLIKISHRYPSDKKLDHQPRTISVHAQRSSTLPVTELSSHLVGGTDTKGYLDHGTAGFRVSPPPRLRNLLADLSAPHHADRLFWTPVHFRPSNPTPLV